MLGRARVLRVFRGLFQAALTILAVWLLAALALGFFSELPVWIRLTVVAGAWLTLVWALVRYLWPTLRRERLADAARIIDQALPDTQERISSAVELTAEPESPHKGSPELIAHLVRQAEREAQQIDPALVVSSKSVIRIALWCVPLVLVWLLAAAAAPRAIGHGVAGLLAPWQSPPPAPMLWFEVKPGNEVVAQGDALDILVNIVAPPELKGVRLTRMTLQERYAAGQTIAHEMQRTDELTFRQRLENRQQSFTYSIAGDQGSAGPFSVTVNPRPTLLSTDLKYIYPRYTGRKPVTELGKEGHIEALVGTRVIITLHASEPLSRDSLLLVRIPGAGADRSIALTALGGSNYSAEMVVKASGSYSVSLVNEHGLGNRDPIVRNIVARPDEAPRIMILSPTETVRVRPDEVVQIKYDATDDFELTALEAILRVDDRPPETIPLKLEKDQPGHAAGVYALSVPETFQRARVVKAGRIAYQLRVVDNAEPDKQMALSPRQFIDLDGNAKSLAAQQDARDAKDLTEAIKDAQERLSRAEKELEKLQASAKPLTPEEQRQADALRKGLSQAARDLQAAADKARETSYDQLGQEARRVAEENISKAADEAAQAALDSEKPQQRRQDFARAGQEIAKAQQRLGQLGKQLQDDAQQRDLRHKFEDLARERRELAEALKRDPANAEKYRQRSEELQRELDKLLAENPKLTEPSENEGQAALRNLQEKASGLTGAQRNLKDRIERRLETEDYRARQERLARDQQDLNQELARMAEKSRDVLKAAGATMPDKKKMEQIVRDLQSGKFTAADRAQRAAAAEMDRAADRLEADAKRADERAGGQQEAARKAADAASKAQALKEQVDKLGRDIADARDAGNDPNRAGDPLNQKARELSGAVAKAARETAAENRQHAAAEKAASDAEKAANEAQRMAASGKTEDAQRKLADAAGKLTRGTSDAAKDAQAAADAAGGDRAGQAAEQARSRAAQQRELAGQTNRVERDKNEAGKPADPNADQPHKELAARMEDFARQADKVAQENQAASPRTAEAAQRAADAARKAEQAQRQAGQAEKSGNTKAAAEAQQRASEQMARAQEACGGQGQQAGGNAGQSNSGQASSQQPAGGQQGRGQSGTGQSGTGQASARSNGQSGSQTGGQAGTAQGAGQPGQGQPGGQASGQAGTGQDGSSQRGNGRGAGQSGQGNNPQAGEDAAGQIAQQIARVRKAQQQASQGGPGAAQANAEAADGLQRIAETISRSSQSGSQRGKSGNGNGTPSANGSGGRTPQPGTSGNQGNGGVAITGQRGVPPIDMPKPISEMGMPPGDWARLPPQMQKDMLHAAQQKGPPAYQEAIKNYYLRIARMHSE